MARKGRRENEDEDEDEEEMRKEYCSGFPSPPIPLPSATPPGDHDAKQTSGVKEQLVDRSASSGCRGGGRPKK